MAARSVKLISLGDDGMCVGVRYEVPVDQSGFDPVERGRAEDQATAPAPATQDDANDGYQAPPPARSVTGKRHS